MGNTFQMTLRPLTLSDQESALQAHRELMLENWEFLLSSFNEQESWGDFLERVESAIFRRYFKTKVLSANDLV